MRKRLWSPDEDEKLQKYVSQHGFGNWSEVAKKTGLQRCGKSCRLRWINYLRPDLKRGKFTAEEKLIIVNLQKVFGNSWSKIAAHLPGRTDSDIKNFWHSHFRKKRPQQIISSSTDLQSLLPRISSNLYHPDPSNATLINSIRQTSSSAYASFLNTSSSSSSSSSYLPQHPLFKPTIESIPSNLNNSMSQTPSSSIIDVSNSSSHILARHLVPFSSSNALQILNVANNGSSTKQGSGYLCNLNQQISSNLPSSMAEEEAPLYSTTKEEEADEHNQEELIGNDFDLIGSLCQRATTWYNDENKVHGRVSINKDSKIDSNNNMCSSTSTNDSATLEMLMFQSTSTSSHVNAPLPPPPEGLDLVVWSCVNRPSQLDQEDLLPSPLPHVTLANTMHNMTINLHEHASFLEIGS